METKTINTKKWNIDSGHSKIGFKVEHFMVANHNVDAYAKKSESTSKAF